MAQFTVREPKASGMKVPKTAPKAVNRLRAMAMMKKSTKGC